MEAESCEAKLCCAEGVKNLDFSNETVEDENVYLVAGGCVMVAGGDCGFARLGLLWVGLASADCGFFVCDLVVGGWVVVVVVVAVAVAVGLWVVV
ncbi:hypothetical protein SO802_012469 [Lithocarpus litseifolius]|uniref:Transmembrane protein n=1 Tax=Lithocarpus litseifolius TaxID=425828 RepID=A0AAW2D2T4_9ROSI